MRLKKMLSCLVVFCATMLAHSASIQGSSGQFPGHPGTDPWENQPSDPDYPDMWFYFSHLPKDHRGAISDEERQLGSGMGVDRAWQLHTGTPETLIAVLDSGVKWETEDLRDRVWLNIKELPLPQGSLVYDKNGDGRVSVSDYERDSRVSDLNHNGVIDVGDLILAFSDGIDQDGNGFIDDISGWDFHEHDNNPDDRTRFGHGTGEAKDSAGALNNQTGGAGACGNCSVVFVRMNDSFVVDSNAFAAGVHYATDLGAAVIQEALGGINHNRMTQTAVNYAWSKNTVIIGSAADENSYHHNYPGTLDPVVYVNAVRYDTLKASEATSFVAFNNCSNLGARVDVAASGVSCSSEATGHLSGIAALTSSYAKSLGKPLTAGELVSLIRTSATDINLGSNANKPDRHSSWKGWDRVTGYGRVNAFNMLDRISKNQIPPASRIVSPKWFELVRRSHDTTMPVTIETGLPRSGKLQVKLEVTRGVDTSASEWQLVKQSPVSTVALDGQFATIELSDLESLPANTIDGKEYANAITLRLTVDNLAGQTSESRRTIYLFEADNLRAGFPRDMGASGESAGLFADIDGNHIDEFVTVDGGGKLHAFTATGDEIRGFPVQATAISSYNVASMIGYGGVLYAAPYAPIAAGDLNGDGRQDIVVTSLEGDVVVVHHDGNGPVKTQWHLPFPDMSQANQGQVIAQGIFASPVIADIDHDAKMDIVVTGADGKLYVFDAEGHNKLGFPVAVTSNGNLAKLLSSPAVLDVNGDGIKDFILGSNHFGANAGSLFAIDGRGSSASSLILPGFPAKIPLIRDSLLPTIGTGIPTAPVVADFYHDGKKEILIHGFIGKAYIVGLDGKLIQSLSIEIPLDSPTKEQSMITGLGHPAIADITGTNTPSPVVLGSSSKMLVSMAVGGKRIPFDHLLGVWDITTSKLAKGYPRIIDDIPLMPSPVSADLDNDGKDDIIVGTGGYFVHAFATDGDVQGFPAFTGGWMISSPSVGDIDGDGLMDVAGTTREGYVFIWKTSGQMSGKKSWPTFKGNARRTGVEGER